MRHGSSVKFLITQIPTYFAIVSMLFSPHAYTEELPDLIIKDISISRDADNPTQIVIQFKDNSDEDFYRSWFDNELNRRRAEGLPADVDTVFPFNFEFFIDGDRKPLQRSYLPRSGRKIVTLVREAVFLDRQPHLVRVEVQPQYWWLDRDLSNNALEKELRFIGKAVNIRVHRLEVRDDCDNVSEGDWMLLFEVGQGRFYRPRGITEVFGIDSGDVRRPRDFIFQVPMIHNNYTLDVSFHAVECDMDGPLSFLYNPAGPLWLPVAIDSWITTCGGEEWWEASGQEDIAGSVGIQFTPDEWHGGVRVSLTSGRSQLEFARGREDCGRNAFTIDFEIEDPPRSAVPPSGRPRM